MSRHHHPVAPVRSGGKLPGMAGTARRGFTLIEILISIMIFIVVSAAMVGILMIATELFRRGEFSRAANDETVAVIGTIEDDLKHLVPSADGGWLYSSVLRNGTGNCMIAFAIANPDPTQIGSDGSNSRLLVMYWVDAQDQLRRGMSPLVINNGDPTGQTCKTNFVLTIGANGTGAGPGGMNSDNRVITRGCLHFGVWLANMGDPTAPVPLQPAPASGIDWERRDAGAHGSVLAPWIGQDYDTDIEVSPPTIPPTYVPMPTAMRLSLVLTGGGRFAPRGSLISDTGTELRVSGIGALSTAPGAMIRIDPGAAGGAGPAEWLGYTNVTGERILTSSDLRGARRTASGTHAKGDLVRIGQTYSIVRSFPQ
jgi:type II secretory pathway pseudopilin PulG